MNDFAEGFDPETLSLTVSQARSLISASLNGDEEGILAMLADIRDTGDMEAVALFLVGMLSEWMEYFSENPKQEWSDMLITDARIQGEAPNA